MAEKENVSKDEQVGFHKGALSTLAKEREEMTKILGIVEQLMQMHVKALKELGVDLEAMAKEQSEQKETKEPSKPLEEELGK
jgi:thiaminase